MELHPYTQRLIATMELVARMPSWRLRALVGHLDVRTPEKTRRSDAKQRQFMCRRFVQDPGLTDMAARWISRNVFKLDSRPSHEELRDVFKTEPRIALYIALLWGMAREIEDPEWQALYDAWVRDNKELCEYFAGYGKVAETVDLLNTADEIAASERAQIEELKEAHRQEIAKIEEAYRERLAALSAENERLRAEVEKLRAELRRHEGLPLAGRSLLVLGDPSHKEAYQEILARYGADCTFASSVDHREAAAALKARYDAILFVTAYAKHAVQEQLSRRASNSPVFWVNHAGAGEMERVIVEDVLPCLAPNNRRLRAEHGSGSFA